MPFVFNDPRHWLDRAAEAREMASNMKDLGAQPDMLIIAEEYESERWRGLRRSLCHESLRTLGLGPA
jgi:hypothetical protein